MNKELKVDGEFMAKLTEIAKKAGGFIREESKRFSKSDVQLKGLNDLVSYVDKESEKLLVHDLSILLPEAGFITEEETVKQEKGRFRWVIDPLDGTTNFVHGLPIYSVSIALLDEEELLAGVVYEVNLDECFYAWRGGGAFLNGTKIQVSGTQHLQDSLLATGFPYYQFEKMETYLSILKEFMQNTHGLRRIGSAAVDLAYVACGRMEGFFEYNLNPYDVAGGAIIVQEAGGIVSDFKGGEDFIFGREILAANQLQPEFLKIIHSNWHKGPSS